MVFGKLYNKAAEERLIADTARKIAEGKPASGWPTLAKAIGDKRASKVSAWLGLSTQEPEPEPWPEPEPIVVQPWPEPLGDRRLSRHRRRHRRRIGPETEADPAALLFQLLAARATSWAPVAMPG